MTDLADRKARDTVSRVKQLQHRRQQLKLDIEKAQRMAEQVPTWQAQIAELDQELSRIRQIVQGEA